MLRPLIGILKDLRREFRNRLELNRLLEKDDRLLRDAGLTRTDIEAALGRPWRFDARDEAIRMSHMTLKMDRAR
ncbi:MAG: hypothetical protein AAGJ28_06325 [Pseudomonadota bacterium]